MVEVLFRRAQGQPGMVLGIDSTRNDFTVRIKGYEGSDTDGFVYGPDAEAVRNFYHKRTGGKARVMFHTGEPVTAEV